MTDGTAPDRLGDYVLERRLGSGGMGVVYLARTVAGRQVAVKVIRREYAQDPGFRARFRREVAAARKVGGAYTAPVIDADPDGDPPWLATLFVPGGSLTDRVGRDGPLGAREAARVGAQLAEALRDIHGRGLVHRDLKPGNVLLAGDGVRVIDFGISRALSDSHRLTETGAVLGSPPFMAPEQLTGGAEVTQAADVFALGAVVAFAATGRSPFESGGELPGPDPLAVAYRVVHEEPDLAAVPEPLRELVALCLAKDPERRPDVATVLRMAAWADSRAQAGEVRASPVWQAAQGTAEPATGPGPVTGRPRGPRTRWGYLPGEAWGRLLVAAVAVAVLAAAGVGARLLWPHDGSTAPPAGDPGGTSAAPAPAAEPWELDLTAFGVQDAPTEGFRCRTLAPDGLLCTAQGLRTVALEVSGDELWRHDGPRTAMLPPEGLAAGEVVFARSQQGLVALDPAGGEELWEIDAPELNGELVAVGDRIALRNGDSTVRFYAQDAPERVGVWEAPGRYLTDMRAHEDRLLVVSREEESGGFPELMLLDESGNPRWHAPRTPPDTGSLLELVGLDGQAAYFDEWDPELPVSVAVQRMDLDTGEWTRTELPHMADPRSVLADDGLVYATDSAGRVTAVDAAAGEIRWSEDTGVSGASAPTVADGRLYTVDGRGRLVIVDAADGGTLWSGEPHEGTPGLGSGAWAPAPVVADGWAYVVTLGNTLYSVRLPDL
ncbi:serine/threonine protein kinase [Streptomyces xiamenensis]|uniref:Serine/threonine protein kinase n=1 Tax=Streptomyces xiamenensis TaxID=408015 RepID=A0A0F7FTN9_9ACTN|nr:MULTISPECIES: serine/threonine-protein kinase [Streptomyces]AKG43637.1 serine/threonine protein kinase [Streptomyces xiamenensis]